MHEFSLATEVIDLAKNEAEKHNALAISEITIEVGTFSGIEAEAFEAALSLLSEGSILEKARLNIVRVKGRGICTTCNNEFEMDQRIDICPECQSFPSEVKGGNEFRIVSLMIEEE
jgi:hydrogenase nickel incorporation protein HypA/HybF